MTYDPERKRATVSDKETAVLKQARVKDWVQKLHTGPPPESPSDNKGGSPTTRTKLDIPEEKTVPSPAAPVEGERRPEISESQSVKARPQVAAPTKLPTRFLLEPFFRWPWRGNRLASDSSKPVVDTTAGTSHLPKASEVANHALPEPTTAPKDNLVAQSLPNKQPDEEPRSNNRQRPVLKLSIPSAEDSVTLNAPATVVACYELAKVRKYEYRPPPLQKPRIDKHGYVHRAPIDPRVIGLPGPPESDKKDGRPYVRVLVDPKFRMIQFPDWIRKRWLAAEWRRCNSCKHVEVKSDRSDIIGYLQGKYTNPMELIEARTAVKEARIVACAKKMAQKAASQKTKQETILKRAQKGDAALETPEMPCEAKKIAAFLEAKKGSQQVKQGAVLKEAQERSAASKASELPENAKEAAIAKARERARAKVLAFVDAENAKNPAAARSRGKEEIIEDAQAADERIQDLCKQLKRFGELEIERKNSRSQDKEHADRHAVWKKHALAHLKTAATVAEELLEKMMGIESAEFSRVENNDNGSTQT